MSCGKYERSLKRMQEKDLNGVGALFPLCLARKGNSEAERRVSEWARPGEKLQHTDSHHSCVVTLSPIGVAA